MPILLFLGVLRSQTQYFPTSPAGSLEGNQKELVIELVGKAGLHHGLNENITMASTKKKKVYFKGYSLRIEAFEERVEEVLILALHLGELIHQKYFLGKWVPVPGPQTGSRGTGKAEHKQEQRVNPSRSKQGGQKAAAMLPAQEGYEMRWGKGHELLHFHNRWAKATSERDSALLYLPQAVTLRWNLLERSQGLRGAITGILPF